MKVLIVDDAGESTVLQQLLVEQNVAVVACRADDAFEQAQSGEPAAIVVMPLGDGLPRFVAHLGQRLQPACPPIVAVQSTRNEAVRDQCLIGGAWDVSPEGQPEDVAARVDAVLHGWLRGMPRKRFSVPLRSQRGRQAVTFQASELDPTGFLLADVSDLPDGELVRVMLPLPGSPLTVWGRLAESEGERGIRFLALAAEERVRLAGAIRAIGEPGAAGVAPVLSEVPRAVSGAGLPVTPGPPVPRDRAADPLAALRSTLPPTVRPSLSVPAQPSVELPPAPLPVDGSDHAPEDMARLPVPPETASSTPLAPAQISSAMAIDDLIGSELAEPVSTAALLAPESPARVGAVDAAAPPWPSSRYSSEGSLALLREGTTLGLAGEAPGAPSGDAVIQFVKTLTLPEQHIFDAEPPQGLPESALAIKCLVIRLKLFAYAKDALSAAAVGPTDRIDAAFVASMDTEVRVASDELQKATAVYMSSGDTQRIKETNHFRNALIRGEAEFRSAIARLRGEAPLQEGGSTVFLDRESAPTQDPTLAPRRELTKAPEKVEKRPEPGKVKLGFEKTPEERRRRLMIWTGIGWTVLGAIAYFAYPAHPREMDASEFAELGATSAILFKEKHQAVIVVPDNWKVDTARAKKLDDFLARNAVETYVVRNAQGATLVLGVPSKPRIVTLAGTPTK